MACEELTEAQVADGVKRLAAANKLGWTRHAEERMAERGIDKGMVRECLRYGNFSEAPHIPNRNGEIQYKFTMTCNVDGEKVVAAASYYPDSKIVVITVFGE